MPELSKRKKSRTKEEKVGQRHTFVGANSIMSLPELIHVHTKTALLQAHCWAASPPEHKGEGEVSWIMLPFWFFGVCVCVCVHKVSWRLSQTGTRRIKPAVGRQNHGTLLGKDDDSTQIKWEAKSQEEQHCSKTRHLEQKSSHNRNSRVTRHELLLHNCSGWLKSSFQLATSPYTAAESGADLEWHKRVQKGWCATIHCYLIKPQSLPITSSRCPWYGFGFRRTNHTTT